MYDLSGLTEAEQNILEAFSVFPYIPLATETCDEWLLADAGVSEEDDILTGLYRKGWLQFDMEQESYSLHPVFAKFIYEKYKPGMEMHHGLIETCRECLKIPKSGSVLECQKYIPFAENIIGKIDMGETIEQAQFMDSLAFWLYHKGEYKKAEGLYKKDLLIREKVLGEGHKSTATSYNSLAGVYKNQGKHKEAEELYKKALLIREKVLGTEHPSTAISYNNLAGFYHNQEKYKISLSYYCKAYKIFVSKLGVKHPRTQTVYDNMEITYFEWSPEDDFKQWLEEKMKETE